MGKGKSSREGLEIFEERFASGIPFHLYTKLKEDGILTNEGKKGSYFPIGAGTFLGPNEHICQFNFASEGHAQDYVDQKYRNAQYKVSIAQVIKSRANTLT